MAAVVLIVCIPYAYAIHLYRNYAGIQTNLRERAALTVHAAVGADSVSEVGYIFSMRRETYIRKGRFNLVWFIAVPATGARYSCSYESGFQNFKVGDGVTVIHTKADIDTGDYEGYIIGLHHEEQGKVAGVWALDLDGLDELSLDEDR